MGRATHQVLTGSVDTAGISTVTAPLDTTVARQGGIYNSSTLAAAAPVWFHRLPNGHYIGLFAQRYTNAVVAQTQVAGPLLYTSATDSFVPSWAVFDPASGAVSAVDSIPTDTEGERVLSAAITWKNYLFVLSRIGDEGLLQHFRVTHRSGLHLQAEEIIPGGLNLGLFIESNDVWVFGSHNGKLALARKNWGRVGENNSKLKALRWHYRTAKGWSADADELAALPGDIVTSGPVSVAHLANRYYLTMPVHTDATDPTQAGSWAARTWSSRTLDSSWTPHPFTVPLGSDATYLGGTAYLQPQLGLSADYTTVQNSNGETRLDPDSHYAQVFAGVASQTVVLPQSAVVDGPTTENTPDAYRSYTLYNKSPTSGVRVFSYTGQGVMVLQPGESAVLTPTVDTPELSEHWTRSAPERRNPYHRVGCPYVAATRFDAGNASTMITAWGAFEV